MRTDYTVAGVTALIVFAICFFASAPGLGLVDSGELTTAAVTLSIAHPTGYPLWTMVGHLWQAVIPASPARAMVLFSVACLALASGVLAVVARHMLRTFGGLNPRNSGVAGVILGISFALSSAIWTSVAFAEVYPLTLLIVSLLLAIASIESGGADRGPSLRLAILASYLWGLGFGNHFTILWFFPVVIWMGWRAARQSANRRHFLLWLAGAFAAGASVNLFLPIRSSVDPVLDWSDPQTVPNLLRHLTAWQYRVWMFKGNLSGFVAGFFTYLGTLPGDTGWPLLLLTVIGLIRAVARRVWILLIFFACWLIGVAYNLNYSIPDISTYFVSFYAPLFAVAVYGFTYLIGLTKSSSRVAAWRSAAIALAVIVLGVTTGASMQAADHSKDTFATDYTRAVLETLPDSALVFQGNWDIQSPFLYLRTVEHTRADVDMLDLALIQRPWYLKQEQRRNPRIFVGAEREIAAFEKAVAPFEAGEPYQSSQIESAYVAMINRIIENNYHRRPVYVRDTRNVGHPDVAAKFPSTPGGYFLRVTDERREEPMLNPSRLLKSGQSMDERKQYMLRQAAVAAAMQGSFAADLGDSPRVRDAARQAALLAPTDPAIQRFLTQIQPFLADTLTSQ